MVLELKWKQGTKVVTRADPKEYAFEKGCKIAKVINEENFDEMSELVVDLILGGRANHNWRMKILQFVFDT